MEKKNNNSGSILPSNPLLPARFSTSESPPSLEIIAAPTIKKEPTENDCISERPDEGDDSSVSESSSLEIIAAPTMKGEPKENEYVLEEPDEEDSSDCVMLHDDRSPTVPNSPEGALVPSDDPDSSNLQSTQGRYACFASFPTFSLKSEPTDTGHQEPNRESIAESGTSVKGSVTPSEYPHEHFARNKKIKQEPVEEDELIQNFPVCDAAPTNISVHFGNETEGSSSMEVDRPLAPAVENFVSNINIKREPSEEICTLASKSCLNVDNEMEMDAQSDSPVAPSEIRSECVPSSLMTKVKDEPIDKSGTDKNLESASGQETFSKMVDGSENPSQHFAPISVVTEREESESGENLFPLCDTSLKDSNITKSFPVKVKGTGTVDVPENSFNFDRKNDDFVFNRVNEVPKSNLSAVVGNEGRENESPISDKPVLKIFDDTNAVLLSRSLSKLANLSTLFDNERREDASHISENSLIKISDNTTAVPLSTPFSQLVNLSALVGNKRREDASPISDDTTAEPLSTPLSQFVTHTRNKYNANDIKECITLLETFEGLKIQLQRYSLFYKDEMNLNHEISSPSLQSPCRPMHRRKEINAVGDSAATSNAPKIFTDQNILETGTKSQDKIKAVGASGAPALVTFNLPTQLSASRIMKSSADKNCCQLSKKELHEAKQASSPLRTLFPPENVLPVPSFNVANSPKSLKISKQEIFKTEKTSSICGTLSPPLKTTVSREVRSITDKNFSTTSQILNEQKRIQMKSGPAPFMRLETMGDSVPKNSSPTADMNHFEDRNGFLPSNEELQGILLNAQAVGAIGSGVPTMPLMPSMSSPCNANDFQQQAWDASLEHPSSSNSENFLNSIDVVISQYRDRCETSQPNDDLYKNAIVADSVDHRILESFQSDVLNAKKLDRHGNSSPEVYGPALPPTQIVSSAGDDLRKRAKRFNGESESKRRKISAAEYAERVSAQNSRDFGQRSALRINPQGGGGVAGGIDTNISSYVPVRNVVSGVNTSIHVNPHFKGKSAIPPPYVNQSTTLPQNQRLAANIPGLAVIPNQGLNISKTSNLTNSTLHVIRDPRLSKPQNPQLRNFPISIFQARKGTEACLSAVRHEDVGNENKLIDNDFPTLVLQWNPSWIKTQKRSGELPDICTFYLPVKLNYENKVTYYSTYVRLHLLDIWLKMCSAHDRNPVFEVNFAMQESKPEGSKAMCYAKVKSTDVFPKREDIVLCRMDRRGGNNVEIFGRVLNVFSRSCEPPKGRASGEHWSKIKFDIWCVEPLDIPHSGPLKMQILFNVRLAMLQHEALRSLYKTLKCLILKPTDNVSKIDVIQCRGPREEPKVLRDKIARSLYSSSPQVTLVDTTFLHDTVALIRLLAYKLMQEGHLVLVCLKSEDSFLRLVRELVPYDPVVAVRNKELNLTEDLMRLTLEKRMETKTKVAEIYKRSPITLSLFSALSLRECRHEFANRPVIGIFDDADLCTEVEAVLPLIYRIERMALLGKPDSEVNLHPCLKHYNYDLSLFNRLYQAKVAANH